MKKLFEIKKKKEVLQLLFFGGDGDF